ncbi:MAG: universal stress protein [Haloferacaceae archaeon]
MDVLVPMDQSERSRDALRFAVDFANRYDGSVHVVHVTDHPGDEDEEIKRNARQIIEEAGLEDEPETVIEVVQFRWSNRVGKEILKLVEDEGYDHVVMGHHGTGALGRAVLGSAAETVVRGSTVPVTVVP